MAFAANHENHDTVCDMEDEVSDAMRGKRPAALAPLEEPPPTRGRPTDGPLGGPSMGVGPQAPLPPPPEEDASAESLFGRSTHPSEGVTPHGPLGETQISSRKYEYFFEKFLIYFFEKYGNFFEISSYRY
mmetsp:Transcript_18313/g.27521  ORF Transcript_18313/g.27521 Transcript_18313/m.27521 type:complete len:130 (+) Transcript_18313:93-482(+)